MKENGTTIIVIPEDPLEAGFEVTDGLTNLEEGGFMPLGFTGAELIFHTLLVKTVVTRS